MDVKTRPLLPSTARTLPARYYTDAEQFRAELEKIYFDMWLFAGRGVEIPEPGDFFLVDLAGESVIVVRDGDGGLAAFYNVCRHRGTRLCRDDEGSFAGAIQCPYHAWTYGFDGALRSAPQMHQTEGFELRDYPLRRLAVDEWQGHVFLHFGHQPPPLAVQLADLPAKFQPWRVGELRRAHRVVYSVRANWKLLIQNYSECLHCAVLHPQLQQLSHFLSGTNDPPRPTYLGGRMILRPSVATMSADGASPWQPLPRLGEAERRVVAYYAVLPNLLLNLHPDYIMTLALWPRTCERTDIVCEWHFHPEEMARPGFDPTPAIDFWDLTNRQDWQISESAQEGIASRAYTPGPYSNREELLHALDRFVVERTGG